MLEKRPKSLVSRGVNDLEWIVYDESTWTKEGKARETEDKDRNRTKKGKKYKIGGLATTDTVHKIDLQTETTEYMWSEWEE